MVDLSSLRDAILDGDAAAAATAASAALAGGASPLELVERAIGPAMDEVGRLFEEGEYFVPELLVSARATKQVFELIRPLLAQAGVASRGRVVLGTVQGDQHDIGKNLVAAMLEGGGFEVVDLGVDVPPSRLVAAVAERQPDIVGLSALLTTTMPAMAQAVKALADAGLRERVRVMVGGAPVTQAFAESIGADAFGANANAAVDAARRLVISPG
ncbi:MAG: corrinoid protein [Polyangiaceae bacterium]|nr:corrinoid protein [Polyangiaceae bacterium]